MVEMMIPRRNVTIEDSPLPPYSSHSIPSLARSEWDRYTVMLLLLISMVSTVLIIEAAKWRRTRW